MRTCVSMRTICCRCWRLCWRSTMSRTHDAGANLPPPCARSISASRSRRRTSCTPRPTWRRSSGFFAKRCIDANIVQFEGGQSRDRERGGGAGHGAGHVERRRDRPRPEGAAGSGAWRRACRRPTWSRRHQDRRRPQGQAAVARPAAASAASTGCMGREVLKTAGLDVDDAQFISSATAGAAARP